MPATQAAPRRLSVALTLGALAGALAASTVIPTAIPVMRRLAAAEEELAVRQAQNAAAIAASAYRDDGALPAGLRTRLDMVALLVYDAEGRLVQRDGQALDWIAVDTVCASHGASVESPQGVDLALGCEASPAHRVIAAFAPTYTGSGQILPLILTLSALAGITTAMGVLRLLSPLSQMRSALDRISAGERGVKLAASGLAELDELVDRLNAASEAAEVREDAILARIQVVQQFARMVAHEVRNPLQSLELLTSLIAEESDPAERLQLAHAIHEEIAALDKVVTGLLRDGTRTGSLHLQKRRQPVGPIIAKVIALRTAEAATRRTRIELGTLPPLAAEVDAALLGRSVENLLTNAMQMVPAGYGLIRVHLLDEGEGIAIVVEDNGPGVDPAYGERIFEADVTSRQGGTGLGLALVKAVVEAHGGWAAYDSSPLGGARFVLRLPKGGAVAEEVG